MSLLVSPKRSEAEAIAHDERNIVGMAIGDPRVVDLHYGALVDYVWVDELVGRCWDEMVAARSRGEPWLVWLEEDKNGLVSDLGGKSEVMALWFKSTPLNNATYAQQSTYHLERILKTKRLRAIRELCDFGFMLASSTGNDPDEIQTQIMRRLSQIDLITTDGEHISDLCVQLAQPKETSIQKDPATTGMNRFDSATGGFRPGEMIILAARPSIGKSAIAAQWALSSAARGKTTVFVSLEMKSLDVAARVISSEMGLPMRVFRDGTATDDQRERVLQFANTTLKKVPLVVMDKRNVTVDAIGSIVRSYASKNEVGLVVVDYIGLIAPTDRRKQRWESITEISNQLKSIALAENVPMLVLCQLTRDAEGEAPKLSHLRESGSIEQDADMVLLLHRANRQTTETELIIAKNRNGMCATLGLEYIPTRFKFMEVGSGEPWNANNE